MRYILTLLFCFGFLACFPQTPSHLEKVNNLRIEKNRKEFKKDSLLNILLQSNRQFLQSNNLDTIRKVLRQNFIYDYKIKTVRIKKDQFLNLTGQNLKTVDKELEVAINDTGYNKIGILEYPDQVGIIFYKFCNS